MTVLEYKALRQAARDSGLGRGATFGAAALEAAWRSSDVARVATLLGAAVTATPSSDRVRFAALVLLWAGLGYLAALAVMPLYVAPGLSGYGAALLAAVALVVSRVPGIFAQAWPAARTRRLLHMNDE